MGLSFAWSSLHATASRAENCLKKHKRTEGKKRRRTWSKVRGARLLCYILRHDVHNLPALCPGSGTL